MANVSEQLDHLLKSEAERLPHATDLIERVRELGTDVEIQVNVRRDLGDAVAGKRATYTDGVDQWFNFRIPRNSFSTPEWNDYPLNWSLARYVDSIGSTGWHWKSRESLWLGYDFDAIVGHAEGVGITDVELERVRRVAEQVPWVEVRKSTGGGGLHLYVPLENVTTENHTEHAAVGRAVLACLSDECDFDFSSRVDQCGSNMWFCARRANVENQGLALLKPATEKFSRLPDSWRDHIDVVSHRRARVAVRGIEQRDEGLFNELASAYRRVTLDEEHKRVIDELESMEDVTVIWSRDHYLLQTHTVALKKVPDIRGIFETTSKGTDTATPNTFGFPAENGSWRFYRFGRGTSEHVTWEQDGAGWTTCWYNRPPEFRESASYAGASLLSNGGYQFQTLEQALEVAKTIAHDPDWEHHAPQPFMSRPAVMKETKNGNVAVQVKKMDGDSQPRGWNDVDKARHWTMVVVTNKADVANSVTDYDSLIRCLTTPDNKPSGWATVTEKGDWVRKGSGSIKTILQYMGHAKPEAEQIMGRCEFRPWKLVCLPFEPEYPGDRQWNLNAPQLAFAPSYEPGDHPTWDLVLDHVGVSLTPHLKNEEWAASGREYLQGWFAALIREPLERLPYLFLYGPQNSGKSILHEAFDLLVTGGVVKADHALTSSNDFNGELERAILCVVEEKDISTVKGAYAKIKEVVTALRLAIRKMRTDVYMVPNYTHWVQMANSASALSMFDDDTRITVLYVDMPEQDIPKNVLLARMREEAPAFLRTLFDFRLPDHGGRLRIPMIETQDKLNAKEMSQDFLSMFIEETCEECEGVCELAFKEFYEVFQSWLPATEKWSRQKVSKHFPVKYRVEAGNGNKRYIRGLQWKGTLRAI